MPPLHCSHLTLVFSGSPHSSRPPPAPSWWRVDQSDHRPRSRRNAVCGSGRTDRILQHGQEEKISARYLQSSEARGDGSPAGAKLPAQASSWGETYITVIASLPFLQMWSPDTYITYLSCLLHLGYQYYICLNVYIICLAICALTSKCCTKPIVEYYIIFQFE